MATVLDCIVTAASEGKTWYRFSAGETVSKISDELRRRGFWVVDNEGYSVASWAE